MLDLAPLAAVFDRDPEAVFAINEERANSLESMEGDLRKWREVGRLTGTNAVLENTHR